MGLLRVGIEAAAGVLQDQYREFFYCDALPADVFVQKGQKKQKKRLFQFKSSDHIISNGSIITINEGQAMVIVEQGKIIEFSAEAGEFLYDTSTEASIFYGDLSENIKASFEAFGKRVAFGGEAPKDQRVYYFNKKEITGNKYGTPTPVPFRVIDQNIGLDIDIAIRCNGEYSIKITDPILFYTNVCGNVEEKYKKDELEAQLRSELLTAMQPAFAKISQAGIRYSALPGHTAQLAQYLNAELSSQWKQTRGIEIVGFGINAIKASEEDETMLKELQRNAVLRNPNMAAAHLVGAQANAMQQAAKNTNGALTGFAGVQMASQNGMQPADLFVIGEKAAVATAEKTAAKWMCQCGQQNSGKFCSECGQQPPVNTTWRCSCGNDGSGKFCQHCGTQKPTIIICNKCGFQPESPMKFCPECGDIFDEQDQK